MSEVLAGRYRYFSDCCVHRQQIQHSTNQLAKETNKHLKELGSIPLPSSPSEQVNQRLILPFSLALVEYLFPRVCV